MTRTPVGMIGLGIMGSAMSANLIKAGYAVIGYDILAKRRQAHRRTGGHIARSCSDVGSRASVVMSNRR
jgi:3-hydroxyisobutyrate dehydrogenase-like beta-hydroxyacid dehydrogenase